MGELTLNRGRNVSIRFGYTVCSISHMDKFKSLETTHKKSVQLFGYMYPMVLSSG